MELDLLQIARDLIRANTVSPRGTSQAVSVLAPLYQQLGWQVQIMDGPESTPHAPQQNLLARAPGAFAEPGLLGVTHLDTVDPGPLERWPSDPFTLTGQGDRLVGLGAADVKIDAACKLLAFARLKDVPLDRPLGFLGTYMEEVGCVGARQFASAPAFPARWVSCGEPSELRIIDAHKGYAVVRITIADSDPTPMAGPFRALHVQGKAAHSSTPHLGKSAILEGWPQLRGVAQLQAGSVANKVPAQLHALLADPNGDAPAPGEVFDLDAALALAFALWGDWQAAVENSSPGPNPRFDPAECVANWGALHSEGANLELTFDARLLPGQSPSAVLGPFLRAAEARQGERYAITVKAERANEAMAQARPSALLDAAQAAAQSLGLNPEPMAKPTNTEAGVFAAAGFEAMVFGPGISTGNAHTAGEHQLVSQCRAAIDFYEALARKLCART